jgi:hypothetical protein
MTDNILRQNNKQRFTKHHTENQRLSNLSKNIIEQKQKKGEPQVDMLKV